LKIARIKAVRRHGGWLLFDKAHKLFKKRPAMTVMFRDAGAALDDGVL
jgi:hypothetical protein